MTDYAWFKLLVRAIGLLLLAISVPQLLYWPVSKMVQWVNWNSLSPTSFHNELIYALPSLVGDGVQAAFGYYLLFRGEWIIGRIISEVAGRCPKCGYDIRGLQNDACPECNTPIRRAKGEDRSRPPEHS